ncbi:hypothetical protein [Kitasatospora sp. NPDC059571]|uniref:hypothetical protein n=1 Tax=Kitasatospora sp. NPDC059571 TaxID=3346871 RepID=UPI0036A4E2A9
MVRTARLADGADEWCCPACGRRIALRRPPDPQLRVIDPGDESAVHIGVTEEEAAGPAAAGPAAADAAEKYGLGPIQEIPRPPSRPARESAADRGRPAASPDEQDRAWLAEIGIDWDGGAAA